ncbi:MAG TPA: DUF5597 domain-containing protein [Bacteroidales bacterium]|nr:DUF5597 domain-containing protein [Bacteroidales bacterium]
MKTILSILLLAGIIIISACNDVKTFFSSESLQPHLEKQGTATRMIVDGSPFLMLGGELHNSTCAGAAYMRPVWKKMAAANLNTVIGTASWELVEPEEGNFNFELVDSMILGAQNAGLKLVIIWFGSWKNGESTYVPAWVKLDQTRFPLVKDENGRKLNILTTLSTQARDADAKAFAALMRHIRQIDSGSHTVLMMQVENEIGTLGTKRDYSELANQAFSGQVPAEFTAYLEKNKDSIYPGVLEAWSKQGFRKDGTWEEVFGKGILEDDWKGMSYLTEELFMSWNYASYVGEIARAGKAEYNIPMYVNAWLKQPGRSGHAPGNYPSGGPTPQTLDVWRAAAPAIDFIAPDIYVTDQFRYVCEQYTLSGNPLFIPETTGDAASASRAFYSYGRFSAMCYAPFGIDGNGLFGADVNNASDIKNSYGILRQIAPLILRYQGTENIAGLLADENSRVDSVTIGGYRIMGMLGRRLDPASMGMPGSPSQSSGPKKAGGAIIINTGPGEFIIAGRNMFLGFSTEVAVENVSFLKLEDGRFEGDIWIPGRRLNGDEFRVFLPADSSKIFRLSLYKY